MTSHRTLAKTGNEVERLLLAAGADERPDEESVRKAATALGLVPKAALVAATIGAARAARWSSMATWIGVGSLGLAGVVGMAVVVHGRMAAQAHVASTAAVQTAERASAPASAAPAASEATAAAPMGTALAPDSPPRPHRELTSPGLRQQAEALDGARGALAAGDARRAVARLDEFDRRFPHGPLHEEALLLRIEALARDGDRAAAVSLADRFLKAFPASVHTDRVASIVQQMREGATP
jgi:Outer membrane lipoprotein